MKVFKDKGDIKAAQDKLESILKKLTTEEIPVQIGYKGGNIKGKVFYSKKHNFWFHFGGAIEGDNGKERYWNVFGLNKPKENSNVSIIVEINSPREGIYRRDGGVFARNDKGIFLLHRGVIGGGREGISKSLFFDKYDGETIEVQDGDRTSTLAVIEDMDSPNFVSNLVRFITKVNDIKIKSQK